MKNFEYKPIRLDDDQIIKIIEMTTDLFPEYNTVDFEQYDADNVFITMTNMEDAPWKKSGKIRIGGQKFHWFELMTYISSRFYDRCYVNKRPNTVRMFHDWYLENYSNHACEKESIHIVDFFYKLYKK